MEQQLIKHIEELAGRIGGRSIGRYAQLEAAAAYIKADLTSAGLKIREQVFTVSGAKVKNIEAEVPGAKTPKEILVVGAHYDTAGGLPGANDNASGVAATLALARSVNQQQARTLRWLFFVNEEPPYFQTPHMGSHVYAKACRDRRDDVKAMLSLETIGYYSDKPGTQNYPFGLGAIYPTTGNFIGFVSNIKSKRLMDRCLKTFRSKAKFPVEGLAAPETLPGVGWSDHWAFWQFGYAAMMVTDTAPFRYPYYHTAQDTPDKLDYGRMAEVVRGLEHVIRDLSS